MENNSDNILTSAELRDLAFVNKQRKKIIEDLTADGTPSNTRQIELVLNGLKDTEDSAIKMAKLRHSVNKGKSEEEVNAAMFTALLGKISRTPPLATVVNEPALLPANVAAIELSEFETDPVGSRVTPKDLKDVD